MIDLTFTEYIAPLLVFVIAFILMYVLLIKADIPGNKIVLAILSGLIAILLVSSTDSVNFLMSALPILTVIAVISLIVFIFLAFFVTKDFDPFKKPIAWTGFIIACLVILALAFGKFPVLNSFLPNSSSTLSPEMHNLKDFFYSKAFGDGLLFAVFAFLAGFFLVKKFK